jgi:hypothetical protein
MAVLTGDFPEDEERIAMLASARHQISSFEFYDDF